MEIDKNMRKSLFNAAVTGHVTYIHELLALLLSSLFFQVRRRIDKRRIRRRLMEACFPAAASR